MFLLLVAPSSVAFAVCENGSANVRMTCLTTELNGLLTTMSSTQEGSYSSVSGGELNVADGDFSSVLGGTLVFEPDLHGIAP